MILRPPRSTRTDTLFPYTTLFRSYAQNVIEAWIKGRTALRQAQGERNLGPHWLRGSAQPAASEYRRAVALENPRGFDHRGAPRALERDRTSTRLNSSH